MPSGSAARKDGTAGDMAPFIIFMAFVILTTVIVISIYRINSEEEEAFIPDGSGLVIALNARGPAVIADDFLFPGFFPFSREATQASAPNIQQNIIEVRRLLAEGQDAQAEDLLRTLFLFYPDDIEILYLLSYILHASGREEEADYYGERMSFLLPSPLPVKFRSSPAPAPEKRSGS